MQVMRRVAVVLAIAVGVQAAGGAARAVDLRSAQSSFPRGTHGFPHTLARADLAGEPLSPPAGLFPVTYELTGTVWAELEGKGRKEMALCLSPDIHAKQGGPLGWMNRSAGVLVYRGAAGGRLDLAWAFPRGWLGLTNGKGSPTWNRCDSLSAADVNGDGRTEVIATLGFIGADDFGQDTFVLGYRRGRLVNLLPAHAPKGPAGAARGPGRTALGRYGGGVAFRPAARGGAEIIVWGQIWGNEAKVEPHRYWGDVYRWSRTRDRYQLVRRVQTKHKGDAGETELARVLGLTKRDLSSRPREPE